MKAISLVAEGEDRVDLRAYISSTPWIAVPLTLKYIEIFDKHGSTLYRVEGIMSTDGQGWMEVTDVHRIPSFPKARRNFVNEWTGKTVFEHLAEIQNDLY